jgi:hypothetical protein
MAARDIHKALILADDTKKDLDLGKVELVEKDVLVEGNEMQA